MDLESQPKSKVPRIIGYALWYWFTVRDWIYIGITIFPRRHFVDCLLDAVMEALVCWLSNETFQTKSFQISGSQSGAQRPSEVLEGGFKGELMQQKGKSFMFILTPSVSSTMTDCMVLFSPGALCSIRFLHTKLQKWGWNVRIYNFHLQLLIYRERNLWGKRCALLCILSPKLRA